MPLVYTRTGNISYGKLAQVRLEYGARTNSVEANLRPDPLPIRGLAERREY